MSKNVNEFIEKLENGFPPMDNGYIVYNCGFWSKPIWYRFDIETEHWEWTDNLCIWHSVIKQNINISPDNMIIINYLRLKSLNKNIKVMSKKMEDINELEDIVHNLFLNYKTLDKPIVDEKYKDDAKVLDYLNQLDLENNRLDEHMSGLIYIEDTFISERDKSRTRNSQKELLDNYTNSIIIKKILIVECKLKIAYLINGLKIRLNQISSPTHLLDTYKMEQFENDINQVCNFLDKKTNFVDNTRISTSIFNFQTRLLNSLGITVHENLAMNSELIFNGIQRLKEKIKKDSIDYVNKIKNMEKEHSIFIKNLELKYGKLDASKKSIEFQNVELECSLSSNNDDIIRLMNENSILKKNSDKLEQENSILKNHVENILNLSPNIVYDENENTYLLKDDIYDMLDDGI